jgi:two-component system CheB/CheR fusion protein
VREAAGQARRLAHGLNPVDLKAGGLSAALESLARRVSESFGVSCAFHWDHIAKVREDAMATHLYRIAQEAVSNAIRHGKATSIEIGLSERGAALVLSIKDNGMGIPVEVAERVKQGLVPVGGDKPPPAGMGLQTMHYRARVIGGIFAVTPRPGGGVVITCTLGREQLVRPIRKPETTSGNVPRAKHARSR